MLVSAAAGAAIEHRRVADLPAFVGPGDVMVVNTSRVLPARLLLAKPTGGAAEVLLLEPLGPSLWVGLVRPGRRIPPGTVLEAQGGPVCEVGASLGEGRRAVRLLAGDEDVPALLQSVGAIALPPYIRRPLGDPERYQTVYADRPRSVAAPTAGLHLTRGVLDACRDRGARIYGVDLAVGLGTFRPITSARVEDHVMHAERYQVPEETMAACRSARRVLAVGTTTLRALESAATTGELVGSTTLFIYGAYPFRVVDVLLTNFHQPKSSLLVLLEAFYGPRWRDLYALALAEGYRFLSFGDAMLVSRHAGGAAGQVRPVTP
jgi:S-adenosylmethionine:tRNA ribosyltransferase-isomerase